ncbi:hypothetical protein ma343 [Moumouvirus australiensis]|uniref:Uncharacterized protein n=1 Tax=Moumouvirus australiensis TaxID=2109587 RepID=A0A2P1ELH6_9VIRU|nr:hypothetical protein QKC55_gp562 [Moumouvirus australiensis]AVL94729.1 hypothetical protein ma343 [Moumouvirus australiensis]
MYVNQIDKIIDTILNNLYLEGLSNDETFKTITEGNKINFVEYRENINNFITEFMKTIDISDIQKIINNKENLQRIIDIIKRYVAYYYFLSIAYYYTGSIKDFRNNLIQYSKLQESSTFTIKNFFDTENNYQLINYFKIIKESSNILLMTELQKRALNPLEVKDTINFLNNLGREYIDNFLLMIVTEGDEDRVQINVHNLIKTIVFGEIYRTQERNLVFDIINDIEEDKQEYTYIDVVVSNDDATDLDSFRQIFAGESDSESLARDMYGLVNESEKIVLVPSVETKNNNLLELNFVTPIVDDFLRYHRDTERLESEIGPVNVPLTSTNNSKNVQLALLYQQRKKKENTRAQLIVNKLDAISDYYSSNVQNNPEVLNDVKKYFQNPLGYRKAILHNYLDELFVLQKIIKQGKRAIEGNEYFLELQEIINNAYFNFKEFIKYGTTLTLSTDETINLLRYSNIQFQNQMSDLEVEMYTAINNDTINLVGLSLGPFEDGPIQCVKKTNLINIRDVKISYIKNGEIKEVTSDNGYRMFLKIVKHILIETIDFNFEPTFNLYNNFSQIRDLNRDFFNKIIYWVYDVELDTYNLDTYENTRTNSFQDSLRIMNAKIYDKIISLLTNKLNNLINTNTDLSRQQIQKIIEIYSIANRLFLKPNEKRELIIKDYLQNKIIEQSDIYQPGNNKDIMPTFEPIIENKTFTIRIDMVNPLHPQKFVKLEAHSRTTKDKNVIARSEGKCKHENEWNEITKTKDQNLNKYNSQITQFIEKYSLETTQLDYVCKICGQILPLKQYVQDGTFDNNTQRFVTAYVPLDIPLEEVREYVRYKLSIRYLDALINRVSLITSTNMLVGPTTQIRQKRKALVKNIVDLLIKHNSVNLKKNLNYEQRLEYFAKNFNINKNLDNTILFFELSDNIFNADPSESDADIELNRIKFNNILLYFILIFITELNGSQISMMSSDKFCNIYVYLQYGPKLFGNLLIKKNINSNDTVPIVQYPVLCYLLYLMSYYLVRYKLWNRQTESTKVFDPLYSKIIINSFVDLFNSISMDAGKDPNDYIYMLTTSKLYSQLNSTFKNNEIINILKRNHARWDPKRGIDEVPVTTANEIPTYSLENPIKIIEKPRKIPDFQLTTGIAYDRPDEIVYPIQVKITDITNCPDGAYHEWESISKQLKCKRCGEFGLEVTGNIDRTDASYYYNLAEIAKRRCPIGSLHDFVPTNGELVCTICSHKPNDKYSTKELDTLAENIYKIEDDNARRLFENINRARLEFENEQQIAQDLLEKVVSDFSQEFNGNLSTSQQADDTKIYGQLPNIITKLIETFETYIGENNNLDIDTYPIYLRNNVYIIDHTNEGVPLDKPIIITENEHIINFRENHTYFKKDVYYYTDNRIQTDVFYDAITLKLLGYRERHREYIQTRANAYLRISYSIYERLLLLGFESKYLDINDVFNKNSSIISDANQNYYKILNNLIRQHVYNLKAVIDKISLLVYKIKFYQANEEKEPTELQSSQNIDRIVEKYNSILKNFNLGQENMAFNDWNYLRNTFNFRFIDWSGTNIRATESRYVNTEIINYYDVTGSEIFYYLLNEILSIIDSNTDRITRVNICQMFVELIVYVYNLYQVNLYNEPLELKRYEYILYGSPYMIDLLRQGQGLQESRELEEFIDDTDPDIEDMVPSLGTEDERDDIREEAEALDVETDYYAEEDEDNAQEGDYYE